MFRSFFDHRRWPGIRVMPLKKRILTGERKGLRGAAAAVADKINNSRLEYRFFRLD